MEVLDLMSNALLKHLGVHDYVLIEIKKGNVTVSVNPECYIYKLKEDLKSTIKEINNHYQKVFHIIQTDKKEYIFLLVNINERTLSNKNINCYKLKNDGTGEYSRINVEVFNGGLREAQWIDADIDIIDIL